MPLLRCQKIHKEGGEMTDSFHPDICYVGVKRVDTDIFIIKIKDLLIQGTVAYSAAVLRKMGW